MANSTQCLHNSLHQQNRKNETEHRSKLHLVNTDLLLHCQL